ncbi:peptidoglycan-binding protein [Kitasatospora sp. NPDC054939]
MRPNVVTRSIVSAAAVVGLAIGTLAGAGTAFAASAPAAQPVVSAEAGVLATNNLGLSSTQAKNVQRWLANNWGYRDAIDGMLGTNSWKAMQHFLTAHWGYTDPMDGIPGPDTIKALQRFLKKYYGYTGAIDGIAGDGTRAAFARFANVLG